ncbi:MAG: molybdopterin-dependent oxidoreductase [Actinomycetota bacterium]
MDDAGDIDNVDGADDARGSGSGTPLRSSPGLLGAGAGATAAALGVLWIVAAVAPTAPFAPTAVAELVLRATPGDAATFFIETLGHWSRRLLLLGALAGAIAAGAVALRLSALVLWAGRDEARRGEARPGLAGAGLALAAAAASIGAPQGGARGGAVALASALGGATYAFAARRLLGPAPGAAVEAEGRRRVLRLGLVGAGVLALGGVGVRWLGNRLGGPNRDVVLVPPASPASPLPQGPFPEIAGMPREITSVEDHYVVDINLVPPSVEADGWALTVGGEVDAPMRLSFDELQERFEVVEEFAVLACVSNEVGGNLIGHSAWGGVRLRDVLAAAQVRDTGVDVVMRGADGYSDSIPLAIARDPTVLLAVSQNGEPLTQAHGFPCRVRVPAIFGMKNVKWLESIEVVASDHQGYWQQRGWSDDAVVKTESRIDVAGDGFSAHTGNATWVGGVAWAGTRGISKVEVSLDGGESWRAARLKDPVSPISWRLWAYRWTPELPGTQVIACRATDGTGVVQTARRTAPHPAGATGYHTVEVEVS